MHASAYAATAHRTTSARGGPRERRTHAATGEDTRAPGLVVNRSRGRRIPWFLAAGLTLLLGCGQPATPGGETSSPAATSNATAAAPTNPQPKAEFQPLIGKWLRTDSDYLIEIRSVDAEGKLAAAYYNPQPIHVAQARAFSEGDKVKVVIELRDVGYPGCVYHLNFDKAQDQLTGTYFQAAMNETYQIAFLRAKP